MNEKSPQTGNIETQVPVEFIYPKWVENLKQWGLIIAIILVVGFAVYRLLFG